MEAMEAILTRRSIRDYVEGEINQDQIKQMLLAAMSAPSAGDQQPWQFIVVNEPETRQAIADFLPNGKMAARAAVAIVVCGDLNEEKNVGYWVQDCSAATQNLLLAAHALGLGAVWLGVHPRQEREDNIRRLLKLPEHVIPLCVVAVGYPAKEGKALDRYREGRVHYNQW